MPWTGEWRDGGGQSPLGADLDSLADVISFGVAGARVHPVLVYFVTCGVARLARFKVTAVSLSGGDPAAKVKYFEGSPI